MTVASIVTPGRSQPFSEATTYTKSRINGTGQQHRHPLDNEDVLAAWNAVEQAAPLVIAHIKGVKISKAISLKTCVATFHAAALREKKINPTPQRLAAALTCFPEGAFTQRAGTDEFTKDVCDLWAECIEKARAQAAKLAKLGVWDAGEDDYKIEPRGWLLGNVFCRRFLSSLLADGGVGKTALRVAQLISLAANRSLTGERIFQRCRVLIMSFEDDKDELRRRVYAVMRHHNIMPADVKGWLFLAAPKGLKLAEIKDGAPQVGDLDALLRDAIDTKSLDVISLDPFVKTHRLAENDNNAIDFVCEMLTTIGIEKNCAVDSPHHTKKGLMTPGDADSGRGASSMKDAGRLVFTLAPMSDEEAKLFGIPEAERRSFIRMDSGKVNIAPPSRYARWFRLVGVPLGNSNALYPNGDEVQTVEPWTPPNTWEGLSHSLLNQILDDLDAGMPNGQQYSAEPSAKKRAAWHVVQTHAPDKSEKQCWDVISTWVKSGTLFCEDYDDPVERKPRSGAHVNPNKRPS